MSIEFVPARPFTEEEIFDLFDLTPGEREAARAHIVLRAESDAEVAAYVAWMKARAQQIADGASKKLGLTVEWDERPL